VNMAVWMHEADMFAPILTSARVLGMAGGESWSTAFLAACGDWPFSASLEQIVAFGCMMRCRSMVASPAVRR